MESKSIAAPADELREHLHGMWGSVAPCWLTHANFVANRAHTVAQTDMTSERFRRMWEYYLLSFASAFKVRHLQLWQLVLSKGSARGAYHSVR